jgi:methionyl aminopeptidase
MRTRNLNGAAEAFIRDHGAEPAFKGYRDFPASLCTSVNDVCVHGVPGGTLLMEGDIVSLDCGVRFMGLCTDACITVPVGNIAPEAARLLMATEEALLRGLKKVRAGAHTGDVSAAIHRVLRRAGFDAMENLAGHGLGTTLHQFPDVPNCGMRRGEGPTFPLHTIVAIEPISTAGSTKIREDPDKWAVRTADGSLSAHFEHTVLVTEEGCEVLT